MGKTVEFCFDFGSPTSYLAHKELPRIAARCGATIAYRPILLGAVFKATGNQSPVVIPAKARYMGPDLQRFAARYGVELVMNPHFPINTLVLMRGAYAAQDLDCFAPYCDRVFDAMWREGQNMGEQSVVDEVLAEIGIDRDRFRALVGSEAIKARLKEATDDAIERGAFGAPTFFIEDEMFWGQDRLDFVEAALRR